MENRKWGIENGDWKPANKFGIRSESECGGCSLKSGDLATRFVAAAAFGQCGDLNPLNLLLHEMLYFKRTPRRGFITLHDVFTE